LGQPTCHLHLSRRLPHHIQRVWVRQVFLHHPPQGGALWPLILLPCWPPHRVQKRRALLPHHKDSSSTCLAWAASKRNVVTYLTVESSTLRRTHVVDFLITSHITRKQESCPKKDRSTLFLCSDHVVRITVGKPLLEVGVPFNTILASSVREQKEKGCSVSNE
jgi:hypothetical protein